MLYFASSERAKDGGVDGGLPKFAFSPIDISIAVLYTAERELLLFYILRKEPSSAMPYLEKKKNAGSQPRVSVRPLYCTRY